MAGSGRSTWRPSSSGSASPRPHSTPMARAGGTSVSSTDPSKPDLTTGVALNGSDAVSLFQSLEITFGRILKGQFTRSQPVVNVLGTELYIGYMDVLQGLEWQGELDSI